MISKVVILCAAFAAVHCAGLYQAPVLAAPIVSTGVSTSSRKQDALGNYAFNYGIANGYGATNGRSEVGDAHGNKIGSYSITDIDGRARRVDYVADALGFRASVKTNEPGTALSAPAAAAVVSPYAAPVAPVAPAPLAVAPAAVSSYSTVIGHAAPIAKVAAIPAAVSSYSTTIGHAAPLAKYAAAPVAAIAPAPLAVAPAAVSSYSTIVGHAAPITKVAAVPAAVSSYSTAIGHAAPIAAYSNLIGPAAIPAPYGLGLSKSVLY